MGESLDMSRQVEPELLDELPADDPRAVRSRLDLRRVNAWMGHSRQIVKILGDCADLPVCRIVDLGGGDATVMLAVAKRWRSRAERVELTIVDRQNLLRSDVVREFEALGWRVRAVASDVFDWAREESMPRVDVIVANLFLHHFEPERLRYLLGLVAERTQLFVACEPRRFRASIFARMLLWLIGCNEVTRHDGEISVRAGFRARELSALWPIQDRWQLFEGEAGIFSHCFRARRISN